jgi:arsenite methyltransferase
VKNYGSSLFNLAACYRIAEPTISGFSSFECILPLLHRFYGCGAPLPAGLAGVTVLDLGCGSGRDCYVASALVGEEGRVIGVDMTDEQLDTAKAHLEDYTRTLGYDRPNITFLKGYIEFLDQAGVGEGAVDLVISNCVINLCPDKGLALASAFRALRPGGELHFSDIYTSR